MTKPEAALEKAKAATSSSASPRALSAQEARFAEAFVRLNGDGLAALREADYKMKSADSARSFLRKLMRRPQVAQAIAAMSDGAKLVRKHREALTPDRAPDVASADEVLRCWTDLMRGVVPGDPAALRVQLRASENLARHLGLLVEKNEQAPPVIVNANAEGDGGMRVSISFVDNGRAAPELLPASIDATAEDA